MERLIDYPNSFNDFFDELFGNKSQTEYNFSQTNELVDVTKEHRKIKLVNKGDNQDA